MVSKVKLDHSVQVKITSFLRRLSAVAKLAVVFAKILTYIHTYPETYIQTGRSQIIVVRFLGLKKFQAPVPPGHLKVFDSQKVISSKIVFLTLSYFWSYVMVE